MKKCTKCNLNKSLDNFYKNKNSKDGLQNQCKVCSNAASVAWYKANVEIERAKKKSWRQRNPDKAKFQYRRDNLKNYGLTINEWNLLFEKQKGLCAICNLPETVLLKGKVKRLAIDHCHKTGKVRGLLCAKCNKSIGLLNEDLRLLESAAQYLKFHNK